jgi:ABC-type dipeptide/oligopeptide/nickel transport system permease component
MAMGREGGLQLLSESATVAVGFTAAYLRNVIQGEFGNAVSRHPAIAGTSVAAEWRRVLPKSLGLLVTALVLSALVGLALGIGAAYRRGTRLSELLLFLSVLGVSTPSFFAAMLLMWLAVWIYRRAGVSFLPMSGFGWDTHLVLPSLVLAARPTATVTRLTYSALTEILEADYVRTATAKGLRHSVLLQRHVLRNAAVPLLTAMSVCLRFSLGVLPIVEYIFNWPGIGLRLMEAIQRQDTNVVVGMFLPLVILFILVNLLVEVLYLVADPRLRVAEASAV